MAAISLAIALTLAGCPTIFFGNAHETFSSCAARCRELGMPLAQITLHGQFATSCVCAMPTRRGEGAP